MSFATPHMLDGPDILLRHVTLLTLAFKNEGYPHKPTRVLPACSVINTLNHGVPMIELQKRKVHLVDTDNSFICLSSQ